MYFSMLPYGLEGHIEHYGDGSNLYRGEDFAQPRALRESDILANGFAVLGHFQSNNGDVGVGFASRDPRRVPARLPLQLRGERSGVLPAALKIGQILVTGDVVLSEPKPKERLEYHPFQEEVEIHLTGGRDGHRFAVPADLPIAVLDEMYPPSATTPIGAYTLQQAMHMTDEARANLPLIGQ